MKNIFESENYSVGVPAEATVNSLFAWTRPDITSVYPTTAYTLSFHFYPLDSVAANEFTISAGKVDGAHVVSSTSTDFEIGEYRWIARVTRDSDSATVIVDEGLIRLRSDTGADSSHVYTVLLAIRATIEGTATNEQSRVEIGGRVLEYRSPNELMSLEKEYAKRWARERSEINRKAGRPAKTRTLVKMRA